MYKTFCLPETSVRILVRPTIGHLLYMHVSYSTRDVFGMFFMHVTGMNHACYINAITMNEPCNAINAMMYHA